MTLDFTRYCRDCGKGESRLIPLSRSLLCLTCQIARRDKGLANGRKKLADSGLTGQHRRKVKPDGINV